MMCRNLSKAFALILATVLALAAFAQSGQSEWAKDSQPFRENKGQWDPQARFLSQNAGLDYWVTGDGMVLDFFRTEIEKKEAKSGDEAFFNRRRELARRDGLRVGHVVRVKVVGADGLAMGSGHGQRDGSRDYLVGPEAMHRKGVRSYDEAVVTSIKPGVDMRHYFHQGLLRYDIIVRPGTDPSSLALRFDGADGLSVDAKGDLSVRTTLGQIRVADLFTYQPVGNSRRVVESRFVVKGDTVSFEFGDYDPRLPLVIDPWVLVYGSYVGSDGTSMVNADEIVNAVDTSANGDIFMAGTTSSPTFPINSGAYNRFIAEGLDAFIMRMDGDAYSVGYSAVLGGSGSDEGLGIGYDDNTNTCWIGGESASATFGGVVGDPKGSGTRMWAGKFSAVGRVLTPVLVRWYNDPGPVDADTFFTDLVVSSTGQGYIMGQSTNARLSTGGFTDYLANPVTAVRGAFVLQFDIDGLIGYKVRVGGAANVFAGRFAVGADDSVVLTGTINFSGNQDTSLASPPAFRTTPDVFPGVPGVFVGGRWLLNASVILVRLDAGGGCLVSCTLGGSSTDVGTAVALDRDGNIYVTGTTNSFNFQKSPGAFNTNFHTGQVYLAKLNPDASEVLYGTALGTTGNVYPTGLAVNSRGIACVGGVLDFTNNGSPFDLTFYAESTPGSITVTADGINNGAVETDGYTCGDRTVNFINGGENGNDYPSTRDGFITCVNTTGSGLVYSDNIGECTDEIATDVAADAVGAVWIAGWTRQAWSRGVAGSQPRQPTLDRGIGPYRTTGAFKVDTPIGFAVNPPQPPNTPDPVPGVPEFGASNGWVVKLRVGLPVLAGVSVVPASIPGGLGATSTVTVTLNDPAPVGGVPVIVTLNSQDAASFSVTPFDLQRELIVPEGATAVSTTVFSFQVTTQRTVDVRAILDNDFKLTRLTVSPWLVDFTASPGTTPGGTTVTGRVVMFSPAPVGGLTANLSTDRPDLVTLPNPPQVTVPEGATFATVPIDTLGVDSDTAVQISATFLGVTKSSTVILKPARPISLTYSPSTALSGETVVGTVTFDGKVGTDRDVTLSYVSGPTGALVNGQPLPLNIVVPSQGNKVSFNLTLPAVGTSQVLVLRATSNAVSVQGSLPIEPIDIAELQVTPTLTPLSGQRLDVRVRLSRPAGPNGFSVNLSRSNPAAGSLTASQVNIAPGQLLSPIVNFQSAIVSTVTATDISASKTGYTTRTVNVQVQPLSLTFTLSPGVVVGGEANAIGTVTLTTPAPPEGLTIPVVSSDTSAATVPATITFGGGQTLRTFTVTSRRVPSVKQPKITVGGGTVQKARFLTVNPPRVESFVLNPDTVTGGGTTRGTITLSSPAAAGTVITLTSSPSGVANHPATVTVPTNSRTVSFTFGTNSVSSDRSVGITARLQPTYRVASLLVKAPAVQSLTFNPGRVRGGSNTTGTITLEQPAPPGGLNVNVTTSATGVARPAVTPVFIPAGQRTRNFTVNTFRVSRTLGVNFTARVGTGRSASATLLVDP
jgi:hypothetical protein